MPNDQNTVPVEVWVPIPHKAGDPQPRIADGVYRGIRSDGKGGFEGIPVISPRSSEDEAWQTLIRAAHTWAEKHMDQWEMVKFGTEFGTVYLTLSRRSEHPEAFNAVNQPSV